MSDPQPETASSSEASDSYRGDSYFGDSYFRDSYFSEGIRAELGDPLPLTALPIDQQLAALGEQFHGSLRGLARYDTDYPAARVEVAKCVDRFTRLGIAILREVPAAKLGRRALRWLQGANLAFRSQRQGEPQQQSSLEQAIAELESIGISSVASYRARLTTLHRDVGSLARSIPPSGDSSHGEKPR